MEFRWVAIIALWTILSGPVLGPGPGMRSAYSKSRPVKAVSAKDTRSLPR
jgi:hypothetical protein